MNKPASPSAVLMLFPAMCVPGGALEGDNYAWFAGNNNEALPKNEHIGGDTDGDGKVDLRDVISLLRYIGGDKTFTARDAIDVNNDGKVDVADVLYLLQYTVGNHDELGRLVPGDN